VKKLLKSAVYDLAFRLGFHLVHRERARTWDLSTHLRNLFRSLEIDCVIDVCANRGQYRDVLRDEVGYDGHVVSFEPIPENAAMLKQRGARDPKWIVYQYALGAQAGTQPFNVMKHDVFSSFLVPDNSHTQQFDAFNAVARVEQVSVHRLDAMIDEIAERTGARNFFLKLDTQGFDLEVIKGAEGCLPRVRGIQSEIAVKPIYKHMPDYLASMQTFEQKGFDVTGLFAVTRDKALRAVEFDCTLVNSRHLPRT
jgi:FkbM family methyltransferase